MAHDKVYGFCESKCKVEVPTKKEFDELKSTTSEFYSKNKSVIGSWEVEDTALSVFRRVIPKQQMLHFTNESDVNATGFILISDRETTSGGSGLFPDINIDDLLNYAPSDDFKVYKAPYILRATAINEDGTINQAFTSKLTMEGVDYWKFTQIDYSIVKYLIIEWVGE